MHSLLAGRVFARYLLRAFHGRHASIMISAELERDIATVAQHLPGARRIKFLAGIEVLKTSIENGSWITRGAQKVQSALYQGLVPKLPDVDYDLQKTLPSYAEDSSGLHQALRWGQSYRGTSTFPSKKLPADIQRAWFNVCNEVNILCAALDKARPKPVLTSVGLSPKVTKTLLEMNLDIDLSTIKAPPVVKVGERQMIDNRGLPVFKYGKPVMEDVYEPQWSPGVKFGKSRFHIYDGRCEACGKPIPSRMYVAVEAQCRNIGLVGLWLGVDCADKIFGIKDKGVLYDAEAK